MLVCLSSVLPSEGLLSVVHVFSDDGLNLLKPLEITDTHVVVRVSELSAYGLVWDFLKRFIERKDPIPSQVLLYLGPLKPKAQNQKLYVFLLPRNIPTYEVWIIIPITISYFIDNSSYDSSHGFLETCIMSILFRLMQVKPFRKLSTSTYAVQTALIE